MIRYLKELLLVLYLLKNYDYYLERLGAMGIGVAVLLFGAMFIVLTVALFMTAYIRQTLIRHLFALTLFVSAVFFDVYTRVTADYLTYSSFVSLVYSGGFIQEAAYQYRAPLISGLSVGCCCCLASGSSRVGDCRCRVRCWWRRQCWAYCCLARCCSCGPARAPAVCRSCTRRWPT